MKTNQPNPSSNYDEVKQPSQKPSISLDELIADTCFCKLKEHCPDKNSADCMRHRNIYQEFMLRR